MKTKEEIKKKLRGIQQSKATAKYLGYEQAYIINCKLEKLFRWVLEDSEVKK